MVNSKDKTNVESLKTLLAKSDTLDQKFKNMDNNIKAKIDKKKSKFKKFQDPSKRRSN